MFMLNLSFEFVTVAEVLRRNSNTNNKAYILLLCSQGKARMLRNAGFLLQSGEIKSFYPFHVVWHQSIPQKNVCYFPISEGLSKIKPKESCRFSDGLGSVL